jgi:leucyl-tRNA synthetase
LQAQQSFARRDLLLQLQKAAQAKWEAEKAFEADAGDDPGTIETKFFGNFPYPYMNGLLHLGHAFSLSKLEFASAYHRLCGKNVLFPQGFHCTGMPIKACADKLKREIDTYGCPPDYSSMADGMEDAANAAIESVEKAETDAAVAEAEANIQRGMLKKFTSKKSKANAKKGTGATQWEILKMSGIPEDEIPKFSDSLYWLEYFPPMAVRDIKEMGCGVDWRRAFITTDVNPFYDSFIKWQFEVLRRAGKVVKDKRYAVFSPLDKQPCADHDRASGEGVGPQEYVLIKMKVLELTGILSALENEGPVYLLAATLRPETMYGQTNCWALPDGQYGAYRGLNNEVYIMTDRSAFNLCYQDLMPETGKVEKLLSFHGEDLLGTPVSSPRCPHERIYVLPLLTILTNKGTGIVTSVPSDAPDDYAALMDLKNKPKLREKYGIEDHMVLPYEVIPIIDIPGFGNAAAQKVCEDMKIQSQNDTKKLAEAKQLVYLKGFTDGVLIVGPHSGKKVNEVKPVIKAEMLESGEAMLYSEPERQVISRSGDECVVALTDQWYITYGEQEWKEATLSCLEKMETYDDSAKNTFTQTLEWLNQWACSRSFGLGTRLPWDPVYLIESLSDSTIYMAYYTVAHFLQAGDMYCSSPGAAPAGIKPEDLTTEVWDYVFLGGDVPNPATCAVPAETLTKMKKEFEYWYPFDLRVSGKDLIQNHLTFCLYNHTAIWSDKPELWPRSMRANGHLLLNAEKMSKSTGNFKTLDEAIKEYSADAMRIGLADAGDGMDDANFEHHTANGAILRLTKELAWAEECMAALDGMRDEEPTSFLDKTFDNEMNIAIQGAKSAYDFYMFREALKVGWYDLSNARDTYRFACGPEGLNRRLIVRYLEVSTVLLAPICPHWCEHVWGNVLKKSGLVIKAGWPASSKPDLLLQRTATYIESAIVTIRKAIAKAESPPKVKKGTPPGPTPGKVTAVEIVVSSEFGGWRAMILSVLSSLYNSSTGTFPSDVMGQVLAKANADPEIQSTMGAKGIKSLVMPFAKQTVDAVLVTIGPEALNTKLPFNEAALLEENVGYLTRSLKVDSVTVKSLSYEETVAAGETSQQVAEATPGTPAYVFTQN